MPMKKFGDKGDNADTRTVLGRIMKLSIEQGNRCLFPSTVAKVRGILAKFKAPFLHALIICPNHDLKEYMKFIISWSKWCLNETDSKGQLPLHAAITRRSIGNKNIVVRHLIRAGESIAFSVRTKVWDIKIMRQHLIRRLLYFQFECRPIGSKSGRQ